MPTLNIRNLPDEVHARLRVRAAEAGQSMEAEARAILAAAVRGQGRPPFDPARLQDFVAGLFGASPPVGATEDFIAERRREAAKESAV
ncbi:MAG: hypothetical protein ACE5KF_00460 [Kiloniellaceae bacterium]